MTPWHSTLLRLLKITFPITRASTRLKRASPHPVGFLSQEGFICAWLCRSNPAGERWGNNPFSRVTCRQLAPKRRTISMGSRLNSGLCLRLDMNIPTARVSFLESARANGVEPW